MLTNQFFLLLLMLIICREVTSSSVIPTNTPTITPSYQYVQSPSSFLIDLYLGSGSSIHSGDSGPATSAAVKSPIGVYADTTGKVYTAESQAHYVRLVSNSGIVSSISGTGTDVSSGDGGQASIASLAQPTSVWADSLGRVFIYEYDGYKIRMIDTTGIISTYAGTGVDVGAATSASGDGGKATSANLSGGYGLWGGSTGSIYVAVLAQHKIRTISSTGIITTAVGTGVGTFVMDNSPATSSPLQYPQSVFTDSSANIYISDTTNQRIRFVNFAVNLIYTIVGMGTCCTSFNGDGLAATSVYINTPKGVWLDSTSTLIFTDAGHYRVRSMVSGMIYTIAGSGGVGNGGNGGMATVASFNAMQKVAGDSIGNLYVSDYGASMVRKMTILVPTALPTLIPSVKPTIVPTAVPSFTPVAAPTSYTYVINLFAGTGASGNTGDGGPATSALIAGPTGIFAGSTGVTYFTDTSGNKVRAVSSGIVSPYAGTGAGTSSGDGGRATSATIYSPTALWGDSLGRVFIAEYGARKLRRIDASGIISTYAGTGTSPTQATAANGDDGPATSASLYSFSALGGNTLGTLYISGGLGYKIRSIDVSGIIRTYLGTGVQGSPTEGGLATSIQMSQTYGMFVDTLGSVNYVDFSANKLRYVNPTSTLTYTIAGTGSASFNGDGLPATSSSLYYPRGTWATSVGVFFISDCNSNRIRIYLSGKLFTVAGTGSVGTSGDGGMATSALTSACYLVGDSTGTVYLADSSANTIRTLTLLVPSVSPTPIPSCKPTVIPSGVPSFSPVVAPSYFLINVFAGTGNPGFTGNGGAATAGNMYCPYGMYTDTSGVTYSAEFSSNRLRKISADGIFSTQCGSGNSVSSGDGNQATSASTYGPSAVWGNSIGMLFLLEWGGSRIRSINSAGIILTYAGNGGYAAAATAANGDNGPATSATLFPSFAFHGSSTGNLYLSANAGYKIKSIGTSGIIRTFAGTGISGYTSSGVPATSTLMAQCYGVFVDSNGFVYYSDLSYNYIRSISPTTNIVNTVAGTGSSAYNGDGLAATSSSLYEPRGIWISSAGSMVLGDYLHYRIRMVQSNTMYNIAGTGEYGTSGSGSYATSAQLLEAWFVWGDTVGNTLISDSGSNVIRSLTLLVPTQSPTSLLPSMVPTTCTPTIRPTTIAPSFVPVVAPNSYFLSAYVGTGTSGRSGDGGPASSALINGALGTFVATSGILYFADTSNNQVRSVSTAGILSLVAGVGSGLYYGDNGPATSAAFYSPTSVWKDTTGRYFIAEYSSYRVRMISSSGIITTYAGTGSASPTSSGINGDGGPSTSATLRGCYTIYGNSVGILFIADSGNYRVRSVDASGGIKAYAGTGNIGACVDGAPATSCAMGNINVFVDTGGIVYYIDSLYSLARSVSTAGTLSTIAGTGVSTFNGDGLRATSTTLKAPNSIWIDSMGLFVIADSGNVRIRSVISNYVYTIAGTGTSSSTSSYGGAATAAQFISPNFVTGMTSGDIIVSDNSANKILLLDFLSPPSVMPSLVPTMPTLIPTVSPSLLPTLGPTLAPSYSPVAAPTLYTINQFIGSGTSGSSGDSGPATSASLYTPQNIFSSTDSIWYIADSGGNKVRYIVPSGKIYSFAGSGSASSTGDGLPATTASVYQPYGVWGDTLGNVFIADSGFFKVRMVNAGGIISLYAGTGAASTSSTAVNGDGGPATSATFRSVHSIFGMSTGSLYIGDYSGCKVRMVSSTGIMSSVLGTGSFGFCVDGTSPTSCSIGQITIFVDSVGSLYYADSYNKIRIVVAGLVLTIAGTGVSTFNGNGLAATSTGIMPNSVWADSTGIIVITESYRVRSVVSGTAYTIAGTGSSGSSGNGGYATACTFGNANFAFGVTTGDLAVSDALGYVVRKMVSVPLPTLSPSVKPTVLPTFGPTLIPSLAPSYAPVIAPTLYVVSALVGTGTSGSAGDGGPASSAWVYNPFGMFYDSTAVLYQTEAFGYRLRKIRTDGIISTVAGTGAGSYSFGDGGPATSANFLFLSAVWGDTLGKLFVADYTAYTIRAISTSGIITVFCGTAGVQTDAASIASANGDGGAATSATLRGSYSLCGHSLGTVYIADYTAYKVRTVGSSGKITTVLGIGTLGNDNDGTLATNCKIGFVRIFMDSSAVLYVVVNNYNVVRKVNPGGSIGTIAGNSALSAFNGDGLAATSSGMYSPTTMWTDTTGAIVICDSGHSRIRSVVSNAMYTIAGTGSSGAATGNDGYATSATFYSLGYIFGDTSGNIAFSDGPANVVRKLQIPVPTLLPSLNPTVFPTRVPSSFTPSLGPSLIPSKIPSLMPTISPSIFPSLIPTIKPTALPSYGPSVNPSFIPSKLPSAGPTAVPTSIPIIGPTAIPTISPSKLPSIAPTLLPSLYPSVAPSVCSTSGPSVFPTKRTATPSVSTACPSLSPSVNPSCTPSEMPTSAAPTASQAPSGTFTGGVSSLCPTMSPTITPSATPSLVRSDSPTEDPSLTPSELPTPVPTRLPSEAPTESPSFPITEEPSVPPSSIPTIVETASPSSPPSVAATSHPSRSPSFSPTLEPSVVPTSDPSLKPSSLPSSFPSESPTIDPSLTPTGSPSLGPSCTPSHIPSHLPSVGPSLLPYALPSTSPTVEPSSDPTITSTIMPSLLPSVDPSIAASFPPSSISVDPSQEPSVLPSLRSLVPPSTEPSMVPSLTPSMVPSLIPIYTPSLAPLVQVSANPTCPTLKPSRNPSMFPSMKPSKFPSIYPTHWPSLSPSLFPSCAPTEEPSMRPSAIPTSPTVVPTDALPTISATPTLLPSISQMPSYGPSLWPTRTPTVYPSVFPSSCIPTELPSTIPTTLSPTCRPSARPTSRIPTSSPTTLDFYVNHPKATLPSNRSISVGGGSPGSAHCFKIVLPFLTVSSGSSGRDVFSDIDLSPDPVSLVYLISGGGSLPASLSLSTSSSGVYSLAFGLDSSKRSVSVLKDIDGDGAADLIIGDPIATRCYVLFGSSAGLSGLASGFTIFGSSDGDLTGWSVSDAGDMNNDTIHDIIIGAPFAMEGRGAFYVIYGRSYDNFDIYLSNLTSTLGFAVYGSQKGDYLGVSVSFAGDVNGDGCDDVIAGAVMTSAYYTGAAFVLYGRKGTMTVTMTSQLTGPDGFKMSGVSYSYCGYSVSGAGDVNKDGFDDVLVGSSPQRASLSAAAYLVYGGSSLSASVSLSSALNSLQGVRILGAGDTVSYAGDVNLDGHSDFLVGNYASTASLTGYIMITNTSFLSKVTSRPTYAPSRLPSFAPTRIPSSYVSKPPSRAPEAPSVRPSKLPSVVPSMAPTSPSEEPTTGVSQPSSWPSAMPSMPTNQPSVVATLVASDPSTFEPSEAPTALPSESPSEMPTKIPSLRPTVRPSVCPTLHPVTVSPTYPSQTREPYSIPSLRPTVFVTQAPKPQYINYVLDASTGGNSVVNQSTSKVNYIVNSTSAAFQVTIFNNQGSNRYTVYPNPGSKLTIVYLNKTTDLIDLTAFVGINDFSQLLFSEGSVILTLPSDQIVHILNLHPRDMIASTFVLYVDPLLASGGNKTAKTLSAVAGVLIAIGGLLLIVVLGCRCLGAIVKGKKLVVGQDLFLYTLSVSLDDPSASVVRASTVSLNEVDVERNVEVVKVGKMGAGNDRGGGSSDLDSLDSVSATTVGSINAVVAVAAAAAAFAPLPGVTIAVATSSSEGSDLSSIESSNEVENSAPRVVDPVSLAFVEDRSADNSSKSDDSSSEGSDALDKV